MGSRGKNSGPSQLKISIVTVSFNAENTIADTLCSVAEQTNQNIEHILIDGASTDKTLEIARRNGKHLTHLVSEPDQGIYDAMNKGIALASGDVIGLLNADDVYQNDSIISRVVQIMETNSLDALYGDVAYFNGNAPDRIVRRFRSNYFTPERLAWGWIPAHPALFFRRGVYERAGSFKTDYRIAGDYEFIARVFQDQNLRYQYLPEVLVKMRLGGISTAGWQSSILLNREVLRACRENGIDTNLLMIMSKYPRKFLEVLLRK